MDTKAGWQTTEVAQNYKRIADVMIPGRAEILNIIGDLASAVLSDQGRFLDLGCGYGDEAAAIMEKVPNCSGVLVDYSDEMIRMAVERFSENPGMKLVKYDLNEGIPGGFVPGSFDTVVSCFALHHIEFERRVPLYTQAYALLKEGGRLIIADRFAEEATEINEWMFDVWVRFMTQQGKEKLGYNLTFEEMKSRQIYSDRKLGDKPGSIWAIEKDMRASGFRHV